MPTTKSRMGFPGGTSGKNPSAKAGDVRDLSSIPGLGSSPGGGHGTHSSTLAWRIPWTEEPGCYSPGGRKTVKQD